MVERYGVERITRMKEHEESLSKILAHFGNRKQMIKTIEELSELAASLARDLIIGDLRNSTIEEIADVKIMIAQLEYLVGDSVNVAVEQKIKRTLKRIEDGYYE